MRGDMKFSKGLGDFFGLDIGTNAVRVVQLGRSGSGWNLMHYGYYEIGRASCRERV